MKTILPCLFISILLFQTGCGSSSGFSSNDVSSGDTQPQEARSLDSANLPGAVRPDKPSSSAQLARLIADDAAYRKKSAAQDKNWAGILIGTLFGLAELAGADVIDWNYVGNYPFTHYEPDIDMPLTDIGHHQREDITGVWAGELSAVKDECGPETAGTTREFRLVVYRTAENVVVLDQDGIIYTAEPDAEPLFDAWWTDGTGSIRKLTFFVPIDGEVSVSVTDDLNLSTGSCVQEYWGRLVRQEEQLEPISQPRN